MCSWFGHPIITIEGQPRMVYDMWSVQFCGVPHIYLKKEKRIVYWQPITFGALSLY